MRNDISQYDTNPEQHPNTVGVYRLPIGHLAKEYALSMWVHESIDMLQSNGITHYRKSRSDGNCYFRSIGIRFLELCVRQGIL